MLIFIKKILCSGNLTNCSTLGDTTERDRKIERDRERDREIERESILGWLVFISSLPDQIEIHSFKKHNSALDNSSQQPLSSCEQKFSKRGQR